VTDTGPVERFARLSSKLIARTDMADIANAAVPELAALMQAKYSLLLWRPSGTDTPLCASNLPSGFPAREYGLHLVNLLYGKRVSVASSGPMRWVEDIESEPGLTAPCLSPRRSGAGRVRSLPCWRTQWGEGRRWESPESCSLGRATTWRPKRRSWKGRPARLGWR
jgi:hypothetical protein